MSGLKTEFTSGYSLFYPLESLPALFAVLGTKSRKRFYEVMNERLKSGGEGVSLEEQIEMLKVGLLWEHSGLTTDEVWKIASGFDGNLEALEDKLADAFADSGLTSRDTLERQRKNLKELKDIEVEQMENLISLKKGVVDKQKEDLKKQDEETKKRIEALKVADMGEAKKKTPPQRKKT